MAINVTVDLFTQNTYCSLKVIPLLSVPGMLTLMEELLS